MKILPMGKSKYVHINLNLNFKHDISMLYNVLTVYDASIHLYIYMLLFNNDWELSLITKET